MARNQTFSDTIDTALAAGYENGGGDWGTATATGAGGVRPSATSVDGALTRTGESYPNDHYAQLVVTNCSTADYNNLGVRVRCQTGTDESCYAGFYESDGHWSIYEVDSAFGFGLLSGTVTADTVAAADILTMECHGTALELFAKLGASADASKRSTTDGTLTTGSIGWSLYAQGTLTRSEATQLLGGDFAAGGATIYTRTPLTSPIFNSRIIQ